MAKYFKNQEEGKQVEELLKNYGYKDAKYTLIGGDYESFTIGRGPTHYINLRFDKERGFHMSNTGTWVVGEDMKRVEHEAKLIIQICEKINKVLMASV